MKPLYIPSLTLINMIHPVYCWVFLHTWLALPIAIASLLVGTGMGTIMIIIDPELIPRLTKPSWCTK